MIDTGKPVSRHTPEQELVRDQIDAVDALTRIADACGLADWNEYSEITDAVQRRLASHPETNQESPP